MHRRRLFAALTLLLTLPAGAIGLAGCGSSDAASDTSTLVVADQSENTQTLLRASGELDKLPFEVRWANFTGGPAILEAFRARAADVAGVGDVPPIQALAAGEDVPIVAAVQRSTRNTRLAVAPGARVKRLQDLRGKKIAYAPGTAQQAIVLRALRKAGQKTSDVRLTPLQLGDFPDAIRTSQVDVAPLGEPNLTRFLEATRKAGGSVLPQELTSDLSTGLSYVYARRAVLEDPAKAKAVRAYVAAWVRAQNWANSHQAEWIDTYYVGNQKISRADGERIVRANGISGFPPLSSLVKVQQQTIDLIAATGEIGRLDAAKGFDLSFDPIIAETVEQIGASTAPKDAS
ncbi:type 2 periplasmic-binding domain-containing protein [Flindersiella endophytica]